MADEQEQDIYASIIDNCCYTSSQEELLKHAKFAREDETFSDDDEQAPLPEVEGSRRKLDGGYVSGMGRGGEFVAGDGDNAGGENLGFRGERKRGREGESIEGMKLGVNCGEEREIEPQSKKTRVSPLVHCSGKVVIEGKDDGEKVIAFSGELKVEIGSSTRSVVVPEGAACTEKLDSEGFEDDVGVEVEGRELSGVKKKLDFVTDTEVNLEDEEEIEDENGAEGNEDKGEGSGEVRGDGTKAREEEEEDGTWQGKRELPRSLFGVVWGEGSGDGVGNGDLEGSLKEISGEVKRDGEFKGGENDALKSILDVLRVIVASEECSNDNNEIDIFETAKRRGMTFPRSRFLPEVEEDE